MSTDLKDEISQKDKKIIKAKIQMYLQVLKDWISVLIRDGLQLLLYN